MTLDWIDAWLEIKKKLDDLDRAMEGFCEAHHFNCDRCPLADVPCSVYSANKSTLEFIAKIVMEDENG